MQSTIHLRRVRLWVFERGAGRDWVAASQWRNFVKARAGYHREWMLCTMRGNIHREVLNGI